jgi:hypothetical protein
MTSLTVARAVHPPPEWAAFARTHGSFYHDPAWLAVLGDCFRYPTHWLAALREGAVEGVLPVARVPTLIGRRRLVSLPFSYAAGPVARSLEAWQSLGAEARHLAGEWGAAWVELKTVQPPHPPPDEYRRVSDRYAAYRIPPSGDPWSLLDKSSTQRGIRKGERSGLTAERGTTEADWRVMARLHEMTVRKHGVPPPPRRFFIEGCRSLQAAGLADLWVARLRDGRVAAGAVIWMGPREWIYGFGASDPRTLDLRPNHVMLWTVLQRATAAGVTLDLGRAAPEQRGLVEFKLRWGGRPVPLAYDYWPDARGLNVAPRDRGPLALAARAWSLLPTPVTRLGAGLYRYLG